MTKMRLSSFSREARVSAVAQECPDVAGRFFDQAAVFEIAHEARLVDGVDRRDAHRHRGEIPESRHQPGMRIGRESRMLTQLVPEVFQVLRLQAAFKKSPRINAGGSVALEIDAIAGLVPVAAMKKMVKTDLKQRGHRGIRGDVAANAVVELVLARHHGHGVPSGQALDAALQRAVARVRHLFRRADRVDIGRVVLDRQLDADGASAVRQALQKERRPIGARLLHHLVQGL